MNASPRLKVWHLKGKIILGKLYWLLIKLESKFTLILGYVNSPLNNWPESFQRHFVKLYRTLIKNWIYFHCLKWNFQLQLRFASVKNVTLFIDLNHFYKFFQHFARQTFYFMDTGDSAGPTSSLDHDQLLKSPSLKFYYFPIRTCVGSLARTTTNSQIFSRQTPPKWSVNKYFMIPSFVWLVCWKISIRCYKYSDERYRSARAVNEQTTWMCRTVDD